ncbi:hypothetical protein [Streptomyces phytophilus]|uniref:hypothetical protein n=1 Tax=Streptomyces phytophilus TaxID=722715 RepID=UPI0015F082D3|nr:hypothetical protein [Streptomyces phytophilus]
MRSWGVREVSAAGGWRPAVVCAVGGLLLAVVATACGQADAEIGRPEPARPHELALLDRAEEVLIERCMTRHGFRYRPGPPPAPDELRDFPHVVDDPGWARKHGYGGDLLRKAERQRADNPNAAYVRSLRPEDRKSFHTALYGSGMKAVEVTVPAGGTVSQSRTGCLAEAQGRLYGDFREWFRVRILASSLPDRGGELRRSPDFRAAVGQWSACMRSRGHPYQSPADIQRKLTGLTKGAGTRRADRIEARLATAEAECARSTTLSETVRRLTRELTRPDRQRYSAEIRARDRMRQDALGRAKGLVGRT